MRWFPGHICRSDGFKTGDISFLNHKGHKGGHSEGVVWGEFRFYHRGAELRSRFPRGFWFCGGHRFKRDALC